MSKLFRYDIRRVAHLNEFDEVSSTSIRVECSEYEIVKETDKGFWIELGWASRSNKRWVAKTSRKRFAYTTRDEAIAGFVARQNRRVFLLSRQIDEARKGIFEADRIANKLKSEVTANEVSSIAGAP